MSGFEPSDRDTNEPGDTGSGSDSSPDFVGTLRSAANTVRDRPAAVIPFLLAGIVGAVSTLGRIETPYPVGIASVAHGSFAIPIPLVPRLEPAIELSPTLLYGLELEYTAGFVGWQATIAVVTALTFGIGLRTAASERGHCPPAARLGWLAAYVLAVQALPFAIAVAFGRWNGYEYGFGLGTALPVVAAVVVGAALLVAPASIVVGGNRPVRAVRESLAVAAARPFSSVVLVLCLGVLAAAPVSAATAVSRSTLALGVGTVASVTLAGTAQAAVVARFYEGG
ncbi:hypothetical protein CHINAEXTREME_19965 [Halobiforma lacisalsi AJ5]|uniref:Uncharacterized protein n=1 Tax=Natronobacterium lacisalsi AJ5 TaxID=358396 RepID=M0LS28_NATLA|nr:hypothetical protein [Halobiforma lacisalsi]APW99906.1 hypothetical protein CHINAEXTREME_19965 [Halobiforma lacisalsi AJ5]EMA35908.1 hypothetical protein C445_03593 [Halobiforma lacisalsi AJ5]